MRRTIQQPRLARVLSLLAVCWIGLCTRSATADDPSAAEALFAEGRQLLRDNVVEKACAKLEESQRLDPAAGTALNLAECEERRGRLARAWEMWLDAATRAKSAGQDDRAAFARSRALALTSRLGTLTVSVPAASVLDGLRVSRDAMELAEADWGSEAPVDPGEHEIIVSAPGRRPWFAVVTSAAGVNVNVQVPVLASAAPEGETASAEEGAPARSAPAPSVDGNVSVVVVTVGIVLICLGLVVWFIKSVRPSLAASYLGPSSRLPRLIALGALSTLVIVLVYLGRSTRATPRASVQPAAAQAPVKRLSQVVRVAGDPWSGYSTFRGESRLRTELAKGDIQLEYLDDPALYDQDRRLRALADGEIDLALTTVDAFLQHGAKHRRAGRYPGVIAWNIDESNGGDAIFLSKDRAGFDSVRASDRVCYASGTPSEHLWDFASLSFANLGTHLVKDNGLVASECWKKLQLGVVQIAVLWQPSTALAMKAGYPKVFSTGGQADDVIVDVVVANREFMANQAALLTKVARAYFESIDWYLAHPDEHARFLTEDCGADCAGDPELGRAVLDGIDFLTREENACLWWGKCSAPAKMPERIRKTGQLLAAKGKILAEELPDPASVLDDGCLEALGRGAPARTQLATTGASTEVRALQPEAREKRYSYDASAHTDPAGDVGTLRLPSVYFREAGAELDQNAANVVDIIADRLRSFPALCVRIHGHTNSVGNPQSNQLLSELRARAIATQLTQLDPNAFPASRFDVAGLGSTAPVVNTNREEDLAASRRTEFKLFRCGKAAPPG